MFDFLPDIPRIYTAYAEILASVLYIILYKKGKKDLNFYLEIIGMGIGQIILQLTAGELPLEYWLPSMFVNLAWMFLTIYILTPLNKVMTLYACLKAFVLAEFIASFVWQVYTFFVWQVFNVNSIILSTYVIISYILILMVVYTIEKKQAPDGVGLELERREVIVTASITTIIFLTSNIGFLLNQTAYDLGNFLAIYTLRTIVNFNGLCIIFLLQTQKYDRYLKEELHKINNVFGSRQYEKYIAYKENSELIQQKLHDLKHQVYIIKSEENAVARNSQIDSIIEEISNMSANIDTGNLVLDTILTSKNIYCIEQKIIFSCLADGKLLNFMEVSDICSIFGNAFDNAIEYVMKESRLEKRLINLRVMEKQQFVIIRFENYCEQQPSFVDGLPETTKQDKINHGYGLKSIKFTAEKYGGTMTVGLSDNWFSVKILLPKVE